MVPALFGVVSALVTREARTPREIRNLGHLTTALGGTPDGSSARAALDDLTATYARAIAATLTKRKKLNKFNVGFTVFLFIVTGIAMYWLVQWITVSGTSGWSVVAIIVTVVVGLALFLVNVAAVTTWYNEPSREKATKEAATE